MTWTQAYDPTGHSWLSTLVAALPIIDLPGLLAGLKARDSIRHYSAGQIARAWMPFAILSLLILVWGLPKVKAAMSLAATLSFKIVLADGMSSLNSFPNGLNFIH